MDFHSLETEKHEYNLYREEIKTKKNKNIIY